MDSQRPSSASRWLTITLGAGVLVLGVVVVMQSNRKRSAGSELAPSVASAQTTGATTATTPDAGLLVAPTVASERLTLPAGAPQKVRFGVILVQFAGAQEAPATARSKRDALDMAQKLASDAKQSFHDAVARGDNGSFEDIGRMGRGVLEPAAEFALFSLPVGGVSDPVETPRGYWIVKRIE